MNHDIIKKKKISLKNWAKKDHRNVEEKKKKKR